MKRTYLSILSAVVLSAGLSSCDKTEGALYSGEANKVSFLSKSTTLTMEGGVLETPVGRTSTAGELSLPITITAAGVGYTDVFQPAGPIVFAAGEGKSYAKINYGDLTSITPSAFTVTPVGTDVSVGMAYPFAITVAADAASPSNVAKVDVLAQNLLEFESIGAVEMDSEEGWWGETITPQAEKAIGANVYKIVSPFESYSIAFLINPDGTVNFPNQYCYNHATYGVTSMTDVTGKVEDGWVILNVGAYTVSAGSFGGGVERIKLPE